MKLSVQHISSGSQAVNGAVSPDAETLCLLIEKFLDGTATDAERVIVERWYSSFDEAENHASQTSAAHTEAAAKEGFARIKNSLGLI